MCIAKGPLLYYRRGSSLQKIWKDLGLEGVLEKYCMPRGGSMKIKLIKPEAGLQKQTMV